MSDEKCKAVRVVATPKDPEEKPGVLRTFFERLMTLLTNNPLIEATELLAQFMRTKRAKLRKEEAEQKAMTDRLESQEDLNVLRAQVEVALETQRDQLPKLARDAIREELLNLIRQLRNQGGDIEISLADPKQIEQQAGRAEPEQEAGADE